MPHLFLICSKQLYSLALFLIISHLSNFGSPGSQGMACPLGSRPIKRKRAWSGFIYCQGHSRRCCLTVAYIFTLIYILTWPCFSFFFPSPKNSVFYYPVPWQHPFFLLFSFFCHFVFSLLPCPLFLDPKLCCLTISLISLAYQRACIFISIIFYNNSGTTGGRANRLFAIWQWQFITRIDSYFSLYFLRCVFRIKL